MHTQKTINKVDNNTNQLNKCHVMKNDFELDRQ